MQTSHFFLVARNFLKLLFFNLLLSGITSLACQQLSCSSHLSMHCSYSCPEKLWATCSLPLPKLRHDLKYRIFKSPQKDSFSEWKNLLRTESRSWIFAKFPLFPQTYLNLHVLYLPGTLTNPFGDFRWATPLWVTYPRVGRHCCYPWKANLTSLEGLPSDDCW